MAHFAKAKYLLLAKGFFKRRKNCNRSMIPAVHKKLMYQYIHRRLRPREFHKNYIRTINAAVLEHDINYSKFINSFRKSNMVLDRKILSQLAVTEPYSFKAIVEEIKIQGNYKSTTKGKITLLEAYAKNLLINGPVKELTDQIEHPYFYEHPKNFEDRYNKKKQEKELDKQLKEN